MCKPMQLGNRDGSALRGGCGEAKPVAEALRYLL